MTDRELMQQALDALNLEMPVGAYLELRNALRDRLVQPEQESNMTQTIGACIKCGNRITGESCIKCGNCITGAPESFVVATAGVGANAPEGFRPQQVEALHQQGGDKLSPTSRPWVGLTNEEVREICDANNIMLGAYAVDFIQAIEATLRSKNT